MELVIGMASRTAKRDELIGLAVEAAWKILVNVAARENMSVMEAVEYLVNLEISERMREMAFAMLLGQ